MKGCEANNATCRTPISALTATGAGEPREVGSCLVVDFCWDVALLVNNHANAWTSHHDEPCTTHG